MLATKLLQSGPVSVIDYRCSFGRNDVPFVELHKGFSISYVRRGSFGYRLRGESFDLVPGSILGGRPGDESPCTPDHALGGDECLSFHLAPEAVEAVGDEAAAWRVGSVPPIAELVVIAELAQAVADGQSDVGLDEAGLLFAAR